MSADLYGSILGLIQQATGNNNNAWGTTFNNSFATPAERAIAGVNVIGSTGGTVDLSTVVPPAALRLDVDHIQIANGALTSDLTVKVTNVQKTWMFWNNTTGAFNMFVQVPGGVARTNASTPGGLVQIPQGTMKKVVCDGSGHLMRIDDLEIGEFVISAKAAAGPGELACNGASLLRAEFPDLFGKIGTTWGSVDGTHFTLPLLTDTNRYLRAGGGSGPAVGTYQANQNLAHSHTVTGAPSAGTLGTDVQGSHAHSASSSDGGHTHNLNLSNAGVSAATGVNSSGNPQYTNFAAGSWNSLTGFASITTSISAAGAHQHNITGAPGNGTLGTASSGSTEARPESAAVLICIRY